MKAFLIDSAYERGFRDIPFQLLQKETRSLKLTYYYVDGC
jgi:hypothetical protein